MRCPKCQHENPEAQKFCGDCGYNLRDVAGISSKRFSHPQSYTPKFLVDKILTNKSIIEGERKLVTVFFADVVGFSSFSEKLDPEKVHRIMDGAFRIMMDEIHAYEGTINQFTGDGVMALFGAPIAHEDHARRACHAALAFQKAMREYGEGIKRDLGVNFSMRAGLNTGSVVVGSIGDDLRMDYTAVGDTVNLASRMESNARPGTILVSNNTYKRVKQHFKFTSLGKVKVKGKETPLDVYELVDAIKRPKSGLDRQIVSEMVGRETELNRLEIQVLKAVNGEGSVVNIIGEAGIGKSRLVAELKNKEVMKQATLLEGRAISMGRNLSFHPVIDLLKQWARIREGDSETAALSKLEVAIRQVYPEEMQEVLPFIATLMGIKLSGRYAERIKGIEGEALEKLILKNVRNLLIKATEIRPLVIVIEDLHWADMSSIELMESLLRLAETQRVIFINVFRPGHKDTGDRIAETTKENLPVYYVEIVLKPLDGRMSEKLINNMLNIRGLHLSVIDKIVERSGGNPFFIEEVVRSFIDEEAVIAKDGAFEVTEKINSMVIPHTINDVLMARIDRLEEKTRNLVKLASVIGRSFFYRILTEVAQTVEDIDNRLSYLKEIQLIRDRRRLEELEYLFKHALAQEAAYESILVQKRKELHLKVADSIEKVFKERLHEFYGMLAIHYSRGENEDKAEEYLIKAGEAALESSGSSEALYYFNEALNLYLKKYGENADPEKVAILEKNIALAFYNRGLCVEAVEYINKVLSYFGEKSPKYLISSILKFFNCFSHILIAVYFPFIKFKRIPTKKDVDIVNLFFKKLEALAVIDPKTFFIESFPFFRILTNLDLEKVETGVGMLTGASCTFSWTGISFRLSGKILEVCKNKIDKIGVKSLHYEFAELLHNCLSGDWDIIKEYDDYLVDQNLSIGILFYPAFYSYWNCIFSFERGRFKDALRMINRLSEIADVYEHDWSRVSRYTLNTSLLMKYRKFNDALIESEEGINFSRKKDFGIWAFQLFSLKARIHIMLGDISEAENLLDSANKILAEITVVPYYLSHFLLTQFIMNLYRLKKSIKTGDKTEIAINRKRSIKTGKKAVKNSWKEANDRTETYKLMGIFYWLINKQKRALNWWSKSVKEGEHLRAHLELSRTYMEIGKRLLEPNSKYKSMNGIKAEEYLVKARNMFEEMNLQWDLEKLEMVKIESNISLD